MWYIVSQVVEALRCKLEGHGLVLMGSLEFLIDVIFPTTMSLVLTHPLTETSTMNNSWGVKVAGAYG
jgi:hypothetical protein